MAKKTNLKSKKEEKKKISFHGVNGEEFNLETYLFKSCDILRNVVDASDFKAYIFPLLFYKRISDVWDEEYQKALEESNNDTEFAMAAVNHRFQIPDKSHWNDLRNQAKNVGQFLQKAMRNIEKENPDTLYGIFGDLNWGNTEKITDELMFELVDHFSKINLSNSKVQQDVLGRAYEYLIKKFADLTNKKAGEFYTPREVVALITKIIDPDNTETIYDPACGTGGMLLEAVEHVKRKKQDVRKIKLFGQESNLSTAAIARINLFLHGLDDAKVIRSDTLKEPAFHKGDKLSPFDCVIANPPFSLKEWGYELWKNDPYGRVTLGLPPESYGDWAWVQHMMSSMSDRGRVGVVISNGALFRNTEKEIRQKLIEKDKLVAVISLGMNLFYGTNIAPSILIIKMKKTKAETGNVLMINASDLFEPGRAQNYLRDVHINEILEIYQKRTEKKARSKIIPISEIIENDYNLTVSRYIEQGQEEKLPSLEKALADVEEAFRIQQESETKLKELLRKEGLLHG